MADKINICCFFFKAMLHEAIFLATCNATMTKKNPFKLQRGCYTPATCLATLRKVEGRSNFLVKAMLHEVIFLATCNATNVALQVARKNSRVTPQFATAIVALRAARKVERPSTFRNVARQVAYV